MINGLLPIIRRKGAVMKKPLFIIVFVLFVLANAYGEDNVVGTEFRYGLGGGAAHDFGPFFLPMNPDFTSFSLYYFTREPQVTAVNFSMAGELDWLRSDYRKTTFHEMDFRDVEVSAVYRFKVKNASDDIEQYASVRTVPYGDVYRFRFAIANADTSFTLDDQVDFLVLLSSRPSWQESEMADFYQRNRSVLSQTVIVPLFEMNIAGQSVTLSRNGVFLVKYKKLNLICVFQESGVRYIGSLLSSDPKDKNIIVFGSLSAEAVNAAARGLGSRVDACYAMNAAASPYVQPAEAMTLLEVDSQDVEEVRINRVETEARHG